MKKRTKAGIALFVIGIFAISVCVFALVSYPNAKLIFSGVELNGKTPDQSIQVFVNVQLTNIAAQGVGFELKYDRNYVEASNATTNEPIASDKRTNEFFEQNETQFPSGSLYQGSDGYPVGFVSTVLGTHGTINYTMFPDDAIDDINNGEYINDEMHDGEIKKIIQANTTQGATLGKLSFRVKDPVAFAKLSTAELAQVFQINTHDNGDNIFMISYIDTSVYPPVISYDASKHLAYEFNIENSILDIAVDNDNATVTAVDIYNTGAKGDLLKYLNEYHSAVTIRYSDTTTIPDTIVWDELNPTFSYTINGQPGMDAVWEPKGDYDIVATQEYQDGLVMTTHIRVEPIKIVGYTTTDDYIVYNTPPTTVDELKLPKKATLVFDKLIPSLTAYEIDISSLSWTPPTVPDDFTTPQTFTAVIDELLVPQWATLTEQNITVVRCVGDKTASPVVTAQTADDGVMTINVTQVGDLSPLPVDTKFFIKLPNGMVIDETQFVSPDQFNVELNVPSAGQATITINPTSDDNPHQQLVKQCINMGNRLGQWSVAVQSDSKYRSDWTLFSALPRKNVYTGANYVFDYSTSNKSLFPLSKNQSLPTTISLPQKDGIQTLYSGANGVMPGKLQTISVESWNVIGDTSQIGNIVTFEGTLKDGAVYSNYGTVNNIDGKTITLVLCVSSDTIEEKINNFDAFVFDTMTVGYASNDIQVNEFEILNKGFYDIYGLNVTSSDEEFIIRKSPADMLPQGGVTSFSISPKHGLAVGDYTATVTISSNRNEVLKQFTVSLAVVNDEVYRVNISVNDITLGEAKVVSSDKNPASTTYVAGDTVYVMATAKMDCAFREWSELNGVSVDFSPNAQTDMVSFVMPAQDIAIQADFIETDAAKLKLTTLNVINPNETKNILRDSTYIPIEFDPDISEYYVYTNSDIEQNKIKFSLKYTGIQTEGDIVATVSHSKDGAVASSGTNGDYQTDMFALAYAPEVNTIVITLTYGEISRSYTVHISRKMSTANMATHEFGNSPYALIEKDNLIVDKVNAKKAFDSKYRFGDGFIPQLGDSSIQYSPSAWGQGKELVGGTMAGLDGYINYDKNDFALFAYYGKAFRDPGIKHLTDSLGNAVDASKVTKSVRVNVMTTTDPSDIIEDFKTVKTQNITLTDVQINGGGLVTELKDLRIRPDIYQIAYSYKDFDGTEIIVYKPLIILANIGDIDVSSVTDMTDYGKIMGRYKKRMPYEEITTYGTGARIYKNRVCDVNKDGNVNSVDANVIKNAVDTTSNLVNYYVSLPSE